MRLHEPGWWYGPDKQLIARALQPAAACFAAIATRRLRAGTAYRSRLPVVCIGNFTAGGTGKTPLARTICDMLLARGERPAVLTRGFGGASHGPHWVDAERDTAALVGDEPLLFARAYPTLVARDRAAGAKAIEAEGDRISVVVMDDGMQNPALVKDLTLAVVDAARGFGNGRVIPAGPLRAPLESQFDIVDAVVVNAGAATPSGDAGIGEQLRRTFQGPVLAAQVRALGDRAALTRQPLVAYAGIGAPQRFFDLLAREGGTVTECHAFPDHHAFTPTDATRLLDRAAKSGAALITTEKDHVRLNGGMGRLADLRRASLTLPVTLAFEPDVALRLAGLLDAALASRAAR